MRAARPGISRLMQHPRRNDSAQTTSAGDPSAKESRIAATFGWPPSCNRRFGDVTAEAVDIETQRGLGEVSLPEPQGELGNPAGRMDAHALEHVHHNRYTDRRHVVGMHWSGSG